MRLDTDGLAVLMAAHDVYALEDAPLLGVRGVDERQFRWSPAPLVEGVPLYRGERAPWAARRWAIAPSASASAASPHPLGALEHPQGSVSTSGVSSG